MGTNQLTRTQYGIEVTRGTAVAATRVLGCAPKAVPNDRVWEFLKYGDGARTQYNQKRNDQFLVQDSLTWDAQRPLYFQALPVLHQCLLDGTITPTETTGGQTDYKWDVTPSMTGVNDPDTITLEVGDDVDAFEIEYVMGKTFKLAATIPADGSSAPVTGEWAYFGRQVTKTTFTAAQALHTGLEMMNAKLARFYLDTAWGGLGGTEIPNLIRGFELEIITGNEHKPFGSANKYFDSHGEGLIGAMLTLDLEGSSVADDIYDLYRAGTARALRFVINGSQIGTGVNYKYQVDMFGAFQMVTPINQVIGSNNLHRAVFVASNTTAAQFLDIDIVTNHNTV